MTTTYTQTIKGDKTQYVLEVERTENNDLFYIMYCKRNGKEINDTRVVKERLSKETKEWYGVK